MAAAKKQIVILGGGFAGVAWFPLGPRDVYLPAYHTSPAYVQNINITNTRVINVTQVTNVYNTYHTTTVVNNVTVNRINYTYANNAAAVTAVSRETFVGAKPVQRQRFSTLDAAKKRRKSRRWRRRRSASNRRSNREMSRR